MIRLIILGIIVLAGVGGYFTLQYSKTAVIDEVVAAVKRSDVNGLAARVDFESLRAFLKEDITAQKKMGGPLAAYAASAGPSVEKVDAVVDYYVLPENIGILYYFRDMSFEGIAEEEFIDNTGLVPPFGFQLTIGYPKNRAVGDATLAAARDQLKVKLVFGLDGLAWKVKQMHVPLFMVPKFVYSTPAIEVFGPRD